MPLYTSERYAWVLFIVSRQLAGYQWGHKLGMPGLLTWFQKKLQEVELVLVLKLVATCSLYYCKTPQIMETTCSCTFHSVHLYRSRTFQYILNTFWSRSVRYSEVLRTYSAFIILLAWLFYSQESWLAIASYFLSKINKKLSTISLAASFFTRVR